MSAIKFTDRDVRERPELVAEAVRYLRWYQGEFDFLVDAKRYEAACGNLPLATARGVLNCMRTDARYALVADGLPEPAESSPSFRRGATRPARRLRAVTSADDLPERRPFALKTYWNARFYYSTHPKAELAHALRIDAQIWYYPTAHSDDSRYAVRGGLRGVCLATYASGHERLSRTLPAGRRFCRRCAEAIGETSYDWGPTTPPSEDD